MGSVATVSAWGAAPSPTTTWPARRASTTNTRVAACRTVLKAPSCLRAGAASPRGSALKCTSPTTIPLSSTTENVWMTVPLASLAVKLIGKDPHLRLVSYYVVLPREVTYVIYHFLIHGSSLSKNLLRNEQHLLSIAVLLNLTQNCFLVKFPMNRCVLTLMYSDFRGTCNQYALLHYTYFCIRHPWLELYLTSTLHTDLFLK